MKTVYFIRLILDIIIESVNYYVLSTIIFSLLYLPLGKMSVLLKTINK